MTNELTRPVTDLGRTWDNKRVRTTREQLVKALAPMFAMFPKVEMGDEMFNAYYMMLADLDPDKLALAIVAACQAHEYPTQVVTVAAIRKAYEGEQRAPGPRTDVDPRTLPPIPQKMFRLPEDEDRRARMAQLRRTEKWGKYYGQG